MQEPWAEGPHSPISCSCPCLASSYLQCLQEHCSFLHLFSHQHLHACTCPLLCPSLSHGCCFSSPACCKVFSLCPSTCDNAPSSQTSSCIYLFLLLCLCEFRLWLSKGYFATFSMYLGWTLLRSERHSVYSLPCWIIPAQTWSLLHLGGYLSYPEITIICWLGNFFLFTPVSEAFGRQPTPESTHKVA